MKNQIVKRGLSILPGVVQTPSIGYLDPENINAQKTPLSFRKKVKRGKITGFSVSSATRLRKTLALCYMPDSNIFSCTLTLCSTACPSCLNLIFRQLQRAFSTRFLLDKILKTTSAIWRVELQKSRRPHIHMLIYAPKSIDGRNIYLSIDRIWWGLHKRFGLFGKNAIYWGENAIDLQLCDNSEKVKRYQCDHMSKHKGEQLGATGRQWGILNKKLLFQYEIIQPFAQCRITDIRLILEIKYARLIRRYMRYRIKDDRALFGTYKSPPKWHGTRFVFLNQTFIDRLQTLLKEDLKQYEKARFLKIQKKREMKQAYFEFFEKCARSG